jgi:hypothetical protein
VWIADVLPHELGGQVRALMEQGARAMKQTLESLGAEDVHAPPA